MTMLDERLRRVGEELDRAAVAYAARSTERTYVTPVLPPPRRPHAVIAVVAALAMFVGAALAIRATRDDDRTATKSPDAIAQSLGDEWLWPDGESDVPAGTPEDITREFAVRVLGLTDFTVAHEAPDPTGMRIETSTMSLSLMTARVPGPTERWVVYELKSSALSLSNTGLVVNSPPGASSVVLFVRDATGGRSARVDSPTTPVVFAYSEALVSALVVFRDDHGVVIDAASIDAESITAQTLITCTFVLNSRSSTASVHAMLGESVSTSLGAYTARVEVVEGRSGGRLSLRVSLSGPSGMSSEAEGDLSRTASPSNPTVLGGGSDVADGRLSFACTAANPASR